MLSTTQKRQLRGLIMDTIEPAFYEDFEFKTIEQAELAKQYLVDKINKLKFNPKDFED